uniref:RING-type domain-containing protein n=1 Tax=Nelumbo nucifera TaxID=4432 RepID=A0A822ZBB9_NELNU|nr:TPA_asm: hypothetical protein HUJ06_014659 [Nelumbo nucifera]
MMLIVFLFKSIFRCTRRCSHSSHPQSSQSSISGTIQPYSNDLDAIPISIYGASPTSPPSFSCSSTPFESENCAICLAEFEYGQTVRVLPRCKHIFHKDCIDQWLPARSSFCPVCRDQAVENDVNPPTTNCRNAGGRTGNGSALLVLHFTPSVHLPNQL